MARDELTGSRIRERRIMTGQRQAALAREIGISASYLNLIEHNRRRIGGKLLLSIAAALGVEPQALTEGAEATLIASLREAAEDAGLSGSETDDAEDFASRFPTWAGVLASTRRRLAWLEQSVEALTDRLTHDPLLAASMHELLSTAAAIRSTATILADNETLEPQWRNRFHANLDQDSRRLADSTQALVAYLDAQETAPDAIGSPQEEVEAFLGRHAFSFPQIEASEDGADQIETLIDAAPELRSAAARFIASGVLRQVAQDSAGLTIEDLRRAVEQVGPDPAALARATDQPMARLLRRLAALPELGAGLVVCDRSGTVIFRKSVEGFTVPRFGACCPLWTLFAVLGQPGLVLSEKLAQLGRAQVPFHCYATSEVLLPQPVNTAPQVRALMLILPADVGGDAPREVGATCRICPAAACTARREPSIMARKQ